MHVLLYASFNHDVLSDRFIFTICSKYTRALVHSYLIGWGLIWYPALGGADAEQRCCDVFCYTLSVVDCHSGCVTVTSLSCLSWFQTAVGGKSLWFDWLRSRATYLSLGLRGHALCSWISMYLCCVWVQVIICRATVLFFPFAELSSGPDGLFTCQGGGLVLVSLRGAALSKDALVRERPAAVCLQHSQNTDTGANVWACMWNNVSLRRHDWICLILLFKALF